MAPAAVESNNPKPAEEGGDKVDKDKADKESSSIMVVERKQIENVIVHPLVLLSVVDHFNRMGKVGHSRYV